VGPDREPAIEEGKLNGIVDETSKGESFEGSRELGRRRRVDGHGGGGERREERTTCFRFPKE
jgi:hypothetical protein